MLKRQPFFKILVAALSLQPVFMAPVSAKTIASGGDWILDDSNPGDANVGSCTASTATYLGNTAYSLNVVLDKTGAMPLEFYIAPTNGGASSAKGFRVVLASGKAYQFVRLSRTKKGNDMFWSIPRDSANFVTILKSVTQFGIDESNGAGELPFSMSGSSSVLTEMQKRCANANTIFATADFEKAFIPANFTNVAMPKVTTAMADAAHAYVGQGVIAYRGVLKVKKELQALEDHYAQLNQELATLKSSLNQLINTDLANLVNGRDRAQATIDKANSEIASIKVSITAKEAEVATAQAAYNDALAVIAPFRPEHDRLLSLMQTDQSLVSNARSHLSDINSRISDDQNAIASLTNEAQGLSNELPRVQDQLNRARQERAQAQEAVRTFDARAEYNRRVQTDRRLQDLNNDISSLQSQLNLQNQQLSYAQSVYGQKQQAYNTCNSRRAPNAVGDDNGGRSGRGGFGGNRGDNDDNRGGGRGGDRGGDRDGSPRGPRPGDTTPTPPPVPEPTPVVVTPPPTPVAPSCTNEQNEMNQALANMNNAQAIVSQNLQSQAAKTADRDQTMRNIQQEVYRKGDQISDWDRRTRDRVAQLENQNDSMTQRLSEINYRQLPDAQNDLNAMFSAKSATENELASAQQALATSTANYKNYKARTNYDSMQAVVDRTGSALSARKSELASLNSQVSQRVTLIANQTSLRDDLVKRIADMRALIAQKQDRKTTVEGLLVPYNSDKQVVLDKLTAAQKVLSDISAKYDAQLPKK